MPTSSVQEDERYLILKNNKNIKCLVRQLVFRARINEVDVFRYTADFGYLENGIKVIEEFKGYIHERHDFELRMKICSALNPELTFRIVLGKKHKLYKTFIAGKLVRTPREKKPSKLS
jgi:hypothetical protein